MFFHLVITAGLAALTVMMGCPAAWAAGTDTWVGNSDANWNTAGNWTTVDGNTPPANGDSLVFGAASTTALNNNISGLSVNNFTFNSGASAFTFSGNAFTLTGNLTNNAAGETLGGIAIGAGVVTTINNPGSGTLALGALTESGGGTVLFKTTSPISTSTTDGGYLLGGWAVIDNGNTTYDWAHSGSSGVNNITAATYVAPVAANANNVKCTSNVTLANNQSTWKSILVSGATLTFGAWNLYLDSGGLILQNGGTYTRNGDPGLLMCNGGVFFVHVPDTGTIGAYLANNGSTVATLYKDGPGTLTLSGANTYSGATVIQAGTLQLGAGGTSGSVAGNITNNAALTFNYSSGYNITVNNSISGSGTVTIPATSGASRLHFGGANTYSGATTIGANVTLEVNASSSFSASSDFTVNGAIESYNGISPVTIGALNGGGTFYNTWSGSGTTTFTVGANGHSGSFSGVIANGAWGSGTTALVKSGAGTQTLSGAGTYTGSTTVENGSLIAGAAVSVSGNGPFGNASSAIALGDATSISGNLSPSLFIGGAYTMARTVTVGSSSGATTGIYTLGGNTANSSTFSGAITLNQSCIVTQATGGTLTISGGISVSVRRTPSGAFPDSLSVWRHEGDHGDGHQHEGRERTRATAGTVARAFGEAFPKRQDGARLLRRGRAEAVAVLVLAQGADSPGGPGRIHPVDRATGSERHAGYRRLPTWH